MPVAAGQVLAQRRRLLGVVEHDQPPLARPQRPEQAAQRDARRLGGVGEPQDPGQLGQPVRDQRRVLRRHPPRDVVLGGVAVGVLDRRGRLADPAHPVHGLHHGPPAGAQRAAQPGQQLLPPGELHRPCRDVPHPAHRHVRCPGTGQHEQRLLQGGREAIGAVDRPGRQVGVEQPGAEAELTVTVLRIVEHRAWPDRVVVEHEHQPRHPQLARHLVLKLGVRQLRPVAHRRAVAEPGDQHVDVGVADRLPAHLRRLVVAGREVLHVGDGIARPLYGLLGGGHERTPGRVAPQLGRVRQEHPPRRPGSGHDAQHPSGTGW